MEIIGRKNDRLSLTEEWWSNTTYPEVWYQQTTNPSRLRCELRAAQHPYLFKGVIIVSKLNSSKEKSLINNNWWDQQTSPPSPVYCRKKSMNLTVTFHRKKSINLMCPVKALLILKPTKYPPRGVWRSVKQVFWKVSEETVYPKLFHIWMLLIQKNRWNLLHELMISTFIIFFVGKETNCEKGYKKEPGSSDPNNCIGKNYLTCSNVMFIFFVLFF